MWMSEWVRLREARKREVALKNQAVDATLRQRSETQRLEFERRDRELEELQRPYRTRLQVLIKLRDEAHVHADNRWNLQKYSYVSGLWEAWKVQALTAVEDILGESHSLLNEVDALWGNEVSTPSIGYERNRWENEHWRRAEGILTAAVASYTFMNTKIQDSTVANTLDPDLLRRIDHVFRLEDWTAVASLAATFVEDRFRTWAGLDQDAFGVNLMTKVLHPDRGVFPLGTVNLCAPRLEGRSRYP